MASADQPQESARIPAAAGQSSQISPLSQPILKAAARTRWSRRGLRLAGLALLGTGLVVGAILFFRHPNGNAMPPSSLFRNWGKPEVALVLTGQMHGYLQPCGCSHPQYGGMARRFNFIETLKDKGWPIVAVDVGDIAPRGTPHDQAVLKYETAMKALDLMKYSAMGLGKHEFNLPIIDALAHTLNNPEPAVLAANLNDALVKSWLVADKGTPAVGVVGLIGPSISEEVKKIPGVKFAKDNAAVLVKVLTELAAKKPELVVILYQGTEKEARKCAEFCNARAKFLPVNLILCLEEEEEPSGDPKKVGDTMVLGMGHKGRYVGVVGAFRKEGKGPFDLKYQLVSIGPEFETPEGKEKSNPIMDLMEKYALDVKNRNLLGQFPRGKHSVQHDFANAKYVGSERCGECHEHAFKIWEKTKHAHAFKTLADAKRPSLRHFDGECVACHVVGFNFHTGYADPANKAKHNKELENVGCESCHGPGSAHVSNPQNMQIRALMNSLKAKTGENPAQQIRRMNQMDQFCQKCHDIDNDVNWGKVPFAHKWIKGGIVHMNPKAEAAKVK